MTRLLWDVRKDLEDNEAKQLENIINSNLKKESYYILKASKWDNHDMEIMRSVYLLYSVKPPKLFGTTLWLVDNKAGTIEKIWELPMDHLVPAEFLDEFNENEFVGESVKSIEGALKCSGIII